MVPAATLTVTWPAGLPSTMGVAVSVTKPGGTLKKATIASRRVGGIR